MPMFLMILVAGGIVLAAVLGALSAPAPGAGKRREWREDDGYDRDDGFRPTEREV